MQGEKVRGGGERGGVGEKPRTTPPTPAPVTSWCWDLGRRTKSEVSRTFRLCARGERERTTAREKEREGYRASVDGFHSGDSGRVFVRAHVSRPLLSIQMWWISACPKAGPPGYWRVGAKVGRESQLSGNGKGGKGRREEEGREGKKGGGRKGKHTSSG